MWISPSHASCEGQTFACRPFGQRHAALRAENPSAYLDAFLDHQVEMPLFVRPAVRAASEIGLPTLSAAVESTVSHAADEFGGLIAEFVPGASPAARRRLARGIRRFVIGALFDRSVTRGELKDTLLALIDGTALPLGQEGGSPALPKPVVAAPPAHLAG